jgi:hypothetical protein
MTEHEIGNCGQHRSPHSIAQDAIEWGTLGCLGHPPKVLLGRAAFVLGGVSSIVTPLNRRVRD